MRQGRQGIFHGWYIVALCFVVNFVVFGISVNTFTVYVKPIQADLGWSRAEISFAITLAALATAIGAPFVGRLIDRTGARLSMAVGATLIGLCTAALSQVHSLPVFYALFVISGAGQGAATIVSVSLVISNWFDALRGRALGIVMTGTGLGAMVMVPVTNWIVLHYGWRHSFLVMGCLILTVVPPILLFVRTRPAELGLLPDGSPGSHQTESKDSTPEGVSLPEALREPSFWLIATMMFLAGLFAMGLGVHLMPYLTDIGHTPVRASLLISTVSGLTVAGKIGIGALADRFGIDRAIGLSFGLVSTGLVILLAAKSTFLAFAFAVVYGFAIGTPLLLNPALTASCLGLRHFGAIFGVLTLANAVGAALGAVLTGIVYDSLGSYLPIFGAFVLLAAACGGAGVLAHRHAPLVAPSEPGVGTR